LKHQSDNTCTIYVPLLDEGTDCWRPVQAVELGGNVYCIITARGEDERWQFETGNLVRCRERISADGERFLEAFELAEE
jgi:hypothetical protein